MDIIHNEVIGTLAYVFLFLSVLSLWLPIFKPIPLWVICFVGALICGLISFRVSLLGLVDILLIFLSTYSLKQGDYGVFRRFLYGTMLLMLGAAIQVHRLPGFDNLHVLDKVQISVDGVPFNLYLNFDKTTLGLFILGMLHQRIDNRKQWLEMLRNTLFPAMILIFIMMSLALSTHYVRVDPKVPKDWFIWVCTNLLFVCMAEEAFFRGFIQRYLAAYLKDWRYGYWIAIVIASILFGLEHFTGGKYYIMLACCAGVGYGWVYHKTQRIEASIMTHFLLNLVHFMFFTYPALSHV